MSRFACFVLGLALTIPVSRAAEPLPGFKLDGTKWTYKEAKLEMNGVFAKPNGNGPFPAILISPGKGGNAERFGGQKAEEFVKWGFVCIAPNYTHAGMGMGNFKDQGASDENLKRAAKCLDILESLPYVDKKRIAAYGHSMGGFVTIGLASREPNRLKAAAITGSGISPVEGFAAPSAKMAEKIRTPFLMLHGSIDTTVRPDQSANLKTILDANKVPNERKVFDGEGHPIDQTKRRRCTRPLRHGSSNTA
jgi:dienelactone hydrolase